MSLINETNIYYTVNAGLWFLPADVPLLKELATELRTRDPKEREAFHIAAVSTENGMMVIYQSMEPEKLLEFVALFTNRGVRAPIVQELRLEPAPNGALRLRAKGP